MKKLMFLSGFLVLAMFAVSGMSLAQAKDNKGNGAEAYAALDVHITNSGKVIVNGAKVSSVSGSIINATTTWNSLALNWQVNTNAQTKLQKKGGSAAISEIKVGDTVSFQGNLVSSSPANIVVDAKMVKDFSLAATVKTKTVVAGTIKSISGNTLVMTSGNVDYTVNIASDTSVLSVSWLKAALASFKVGDKVRVYGTVNANATIDATVIRNLNLI